MNNTMNSQEAENCDRCLITVDGLARILDNLTARGFTLIGPKHADNTIVYDQIDSIKDLPQNWRDEQGPGFYRIRETDDQKYFNYTVGPHSWKKYLHSPQLRLLQAKRQGSSFQVIPEDTTPPSYAFIGVRPCEIKAIEIQDRVFRGKDFTETHYDETRSLAFILAVNCGRANDTCFCTSMDSGPKAKEGYDLAITEILDRESHRFVVDIGSKKGREALDGIHIEEAGPEYLDICEKQYQETCSQMSRKIKTDGLRDTLLENPNHPRWEEVAQRCLSCANCTMACPTCFCTTVEDTTDLTGDHAERWRRWDSCFTMDFSYVAGSHIRNSTKSRYRQWMTHKLATWHDQFGTSGCVGCGRCITWCPAGIDITEEAAAIQNTPMN